MQGEKRPSRRAVRVAIALVVVALLVSLTALVLPNVLLRSDFIRKRMNKEPERGWLEYDSASSRWPGTLTVRNLRYRDRDDGAEWGFQLDEADLTYSIAGLFRRRFHVTRLSGRGLAFRARQRLTPAQATPARLRLIPPIPGLPDPPLLGPAKPRPPATGREWTIRVDGLAIEEACEIWIDGYRYTGRARVTGGFFLRPKQRVEVFSGKLATRDGTLRSGKDAIAEDVRATLAATIAPWDPREFPGSRMLRFVDATAEVTARLDDAEIVNRLVGSPAGVRFERGSGGLNVAGNVEKGVARGTVAYGSPDLALRVLDVAMSGRFDGEMRLSGIDIRTLGGGRLNGGQVKLSDATFTDREGKSRPWWARVDFSRGEFRPRSTALFTTRASARARDARPLLQILEVDLPEWLERLLKLDEELVGEAETRVGNSLLEIKRLAAGTGKVRIWGDYAARGSSKTGTFYVDGGLLSVGISISGDDARVRILTPKKWFRERTGWEPASAPRNSEPR